MTPIQYVSLRKGGPLRPYLALTVKGPKGSERVLGLLDTGADRTCLPEEFAVFLGYTQSTLAAAPVTGVSETQIFKEGLVPASAFVEGVEESTFELVLLFGSNQVIWGRDVMENFVVTFDERDKTLTVVPH